MAKPAILLIGGLDPQGCAGMAADLATVQAHDCHGLALITAMTEQSSHGLIRLGAVSPAQLLNQYRSSVADFDIKAIKIGLIPNAAIARCVLHILQQHQVPVVLDPVLGSTSGGQGVDEETQQLLVNEIMPAVTLVTPNLPELKQLTHSLGTMEHAAESLCQAGAQSCLVKGGHNESVWASDYFITGDQAFYLYQSKQAVNVRGTGCVLASSLACHLARGQEVRDAVVLAKAYVTRGIRLSTRSGPYRLIHHSRAEMLIEDVPKLCYHADSIGKSYTFPACPERLGIYPVVDSKDWVDKLVQQGISTIQLRVKDRQEAELSQEIQQAVQAIAGQDIHLFINDHWQLALQHGAYGVHLGQEDLHVANLTQIMNAGLRLGVSTHSYWELARALAVNPSYIALGPIYATTSKQMTWVPQGKARLQEWLRLLKGRYPVVAIGGINAARAAELKTTGVGSVAMISAITQAQDYRQATQQLLALWQE